MTLQTIIINEQEKYARAKLQNKEIRGTRKKVLAKHFVGRETELSQSLSKDKVGLRIIS